MIFGDFAIADAERVILADALGLPGRTLAKGAMISRRDLAGLAAAGITAVTGGRLEPGDFGEDDAAEIVATALTGPHLSRTAAVSGRVDLIAAARGVAVIDRQRVEALNLIDEAVAVATVPPGTIVDRGQPVAAVKVIPLGVDRRVVDAFVTFAGESPPLALVAPFRPLTVSMILSARPGAKRGALDKLAAAARTRVEAVGGRWIDELSCRHDTDGLGGAIESALARGCSLLLIGGSSSTIDRRDAVPQAIERAGGSVERFGFPASPGSLLVVGRIGSVPVIGVPGCVRSPRPNGFDLVLSRMMADLPVGRRDIASMAVGGLLEEWNAAEAPSRLAAVAGARR